MRAMMAGPPSLAKGADERETPDSPDRKALSQPHAPVSVARPSTWARSGGRVRTDATGERRSPPLHQCFRGLRACRPDPNGESGLNGRLREAEVPLHYHNGFLQFATDDLSEEQLVEPFWSIVSDPKWS